MGEGCVAGLDPNPNPAVLSAPRASDVTSLTLRVPLLQKTANISKMFSELDPRVLKVDLGGCLVILVNSVFQMSTKVTVSFGPDIGSEGLKHSEGEKSVCYFYFPRTWGIGESVLGKTKLLWIKI